MKGDGTVRTEHLEFLINLTNGETINSLANKLHITPQGLSTAIISMEKELNCTLLNRTKKGVYLTPEGEELVLYAKDFFENLDNMKRRNLEELSGELILPSTSGSIKYLLYDKIAKFVKENPHVKLKYQFYSRADIPLNVINENELIFTAVTYSKDSLSPISSRLLSNNSLKFVSLIDLQMCVECHEDLWHKSTISCADLHDCKVILSSNEKDLEETKTYFSPEANIDFTCEMIPEIYYQLLLNKVGYGFNVFTQEKNHYPNSDKIHQAIITDNIKVEFGYIEKIGITHSAIVQRFLDFIS